MIRMLIGFSAALLAAPTMAGVTATKDVSAAQAQAAGARIPMVVQLVEAHRVDERRVVVTLRLWSSTYVPVAAAIPSNLAGWTLYGADGRTVSGVQFRTIGHEPYVTTGASGHNVFLLRYDEPVTIPVMIGQDVPHKGSASLAIAIVGCGDTNCVPFHFTFPHAPAI